MDTATISELARKYPRLLRRQYLFRTQLDHGWAPIVGDLLAKLDAMLDDEQARRLIISKIGEKFGMLYVHADFYERDETGRLDQLDADSSTVKRIKTMLEEASEKSIQICEHCGAESSLQRLAGWVTTLCTSCQAKRQWEPPRCTAHSVALQGQCTTLVHLGMSRTQKLHQRRQPGDSTSARAGFGYHRGQLQQCARQRSPRSPAT